MTAYLEPNLRVLARQDAARAAAIAAGGPLPGAVERSATGEPTLTADGVLLHSRQDPRREAMRWAADARAQLDGVDTAVVLGFALGYHVETLAAAWDGRIVVVEPDAALLRTALGARDLGPVLSRVELAPDPLPDEQPDGWGRTAVLPHAPSVLRAGDRLRAVGERIAGRSALRGLRLRILVVSPLAGGSHPMAQYCARALAELGHAVSILDLAPFASGFEAIEGFTSRRSARRGLELAYARFLGAGAMSAIETVKPDLLLAMAQAPLIPEVLDEIGRRGVTRALWFVEDQRRFPYWREVAPCYDYFFTIQTNEFLAEVERLCPGRAGYLPCAADPAVHQPLALTPEERVRFGAPVSFVGAGYRNRRIAFRTLLDLGLKIWGNDWTGAGVLEGVVQSGGARVAADDIVRVFNASEVNLNLHSSTYVDGVEPRGDFVNPRTFELAAAGAFQLVDERALLPPLLRPGTEVATFAAADELRDRVSWFLAHPEERAAIAAAGRARVLAEHTYRHRMASLLQTISARESTRWRAVAREETVGDAARAEPDTPLGRFLGGLPPETPFTLDAVVRTLLGRQGDFSDPEAILLFIHQFDELYVREHRQ